MFHSKDRRISAFASLTNLLGLLAVMVAYWHVNSGALQPTTPLLTRFILYYVGQGILIWLLIEKLATLLPASQSKQRWVYCLLYSFFYTYLYIDLLALNYLRVHIEGTLLMIALEPAFTRDAAISAKDVAIFVLGLLGMVVLQMTLTGLGRRSAWAHALGRIVRGKAAQATAGLLILGTWALWSFEHYVHAKNTKTLTAGISFYVPRYLDMGGERVWEALGFTKEFEAVPLALVGESADQAIEASSYQEFHEDFAVPAELTAAKDWNILVLAAESWRWDMFTPEIMPRLWAWTERRGWASPAHFSTGNSTAEGFFGLFSGQSPLYWYVSERDTLHPIFFPILKRLGYRTQALSTATLHYRGIDDYIFGQDIDTLLTLTDHHQRKDLEKWRNLPWAKKDARLAEMYLEQLESRGPGRYFDFLFFFSTHYNYYYPPEFEEFEPVLEPGFSLFNAFLIARIPELFNRYRNASHYLDYLYTSILEALEKKGELDRTIVVITGDHGEEFMEQGRISHSMALNNYQTRVPLIVFMPGGKRRFDYTVTSHADIVPTILAELQPSIALDSLFTGKDLAVYEPDRNAAVVVSLMRQNVPLEFLLVQDGHKYHFRNGRDDVSLGHHYALDGALLPEPPPDLEQRALNYLRRQKRHFAVPRVPRLVTEADTAGHRQEATRP